MRKIIIDLDGVVFDTIFTIVDLYNEDHIYYKDFQVVTPDKVKTWDFDELTLEPREYIDKYFNQPRFFTNVKLMTCSKWIINKLHDVYNYRIIFCSSGSYPNLQLKRDWININFPFAEFIPVEMPTYEDKSHVPMQDSIFIDDVSKNLITSNADIKICFGEDFSWNEGWDGIRCRNWIEVYEYIKKLEGGKV
jgi:5'(3')-deoxyribonucleotidase